MNVTLFGATGLTGVLVTKTVLEAGHNVRIYGCTVFIAVMHS
jgi:uncharacterized protein YbjT (DUF2867 family)